MTVTEQCVHIFIIRRALKTVVIVFPPWFIFFERYRSGCAEAVGVKQNQFLNIELCSTSDV